jgi:hypothetical protein
VDRGSRFTFGKSVGQSPREESFLRFSGGKARIAKLAGGLEEFRIAHSLRSTTLEVVEGATGERVGQS